MTTKRMWAAAAAVLACSTLSDGDALGQAARCFFRPWTTETSDR
jgi:hypothetical protein